MSKLTFTLRMDLRRGCTSVPDFLRVKKHSGLWIAIVLSEKYGSENVLTYRRSTGGSSSTRSVPDLWKDSLFRVSSYTPHRVTRIRKN